MVKPLLSICLCCYNDAPYLDLLLKSIKDNTKLLYEVCIIDNDSTDNTSEIIDKHIFSDGHISNWINAKNVGVIGVNKAVAMSIGEYIVDMNSDMVVLPNWDIKMMNFLRRLEAINNGLASVSATLIEPYPGNPEYYFGDFGTHPDNFKYDGLLRNISHYQKDGIKKKDTIQFSHPIMMSRKTWDNIGGISLGYPFPGMCTDVDLGFKLLWSRAKCVMVGDAFVYHFSSATLNRMRSEGYGTPAGVQEFIKKWHKHPDDMYKKYKVREEYKWPTTS